MLRAVIVSHCSHGITGQSTLAVRMGADTRATLFNSVLGGFMVGSGPTHQGSLEPAMQELIAAHKSGDPAAYTREQLAKGRRLVGFGHRYHSFDPRARVHMELCDMHEYLGQYVQTARAMDDVLRRRKGIRMNIEASGGSILLDMGFPAEAAHLIILIGRGPMLAAAYLERLAEKKRPFQKIVVTDTYEED
jgi:citrate synthase